MNRQQHGLALILALMMGMVLSVVMILMQYQAKATLRLAQQAHDQVAAKAKVTSVREELIFTLTTTPLWLTGAAHQQIEALQLPKDFNLAGAAFSWHDAQIRIADSGGKISLNPLDEYGLIQLLQSADIKETAPLLDAVNDWVDEDSLTHLYGAEAPDYAIGGYPPNRPLQFVDELRHVKGFSAIDWNKIKPHLTLIGYEKTNPYFASDQLLEVLLGPTMRDRMVAERSSGEFSQELAAALRSDEETFYASKRLEIEVTAEVGDAAFSESIVLVRQPGAERISHITQRKPGVELVELIEHQ